MAEVGALTVCQDLWLWDHLLLSLRQDVQVSRSQMYFKPSNWRKNKEETYLQNKLGLKNPLYNVVIQIGFCLTLHRTQLDLLKSFMFIPVPLTSSVLHGVFLFFFEILVFPLVYGCYYSGSVDISNLQIFSWLNWCRVTDVSFPPISYRRRLLLQSFTEWQNRHERVAWKF